MLHMKRSQPWLGNWVVAVVSWLHGWRRRRPDRYGPCRCKHESFKELCSRRIASDPCRVLTRRCLSSTGGTRHRTRRVSVHATDCTERQEAEEAELAAENEEKGTEDHDSISTLSKEEDSDDGLDWMK